LMALPEAFLRVGDVPEGSSDVIAHVREALGVHGRDVPGPILLIPIEVLQIAAARDVDSDLLNPGLGPADVSAPTSLFELYLRFLENVREAAFDRRLNWGLNQLRTVFGPEQLTKLFADFPELASDAAREALQVRVDQARDAEESLFTRSQLALRDAAARGDYIGAWEAHEAALEKMWRDHVGPRIGELTAQVEAAEARQDWAAVIEAADELLAIAGAAGAEIEASVSFRMAAALFESYGEGRRERLERAIELLMRVLELYEGDPGVAALARSEVLMNLGAVYGARLAGDPVANQERAAEYHRQALALTSIDSDGRGWAIAKTNLGLSLLELGEYAGERDDVDGSEAQQSGYVEEAIGHFTDALKWRSFDRDPLDWAFKRSTSALRTAAGKAETGAAISSRRSRTTKTPPKGTARQARPATTGKPSTICLPRSSRSREWARSLRTPGSRSWMTRLLMRDGPSSYARWLRLRSMRGEHGASSLMCSSRAAIAPVQWRRIKRR
jgi:tetratricopeptide (TPR) repeat protein